MDRRRFLQGFFIASTITTKAWAKRSPLPATERRDLYPQGVASGDPTYNSVILWTRRPPINNSSANKLNVEISATPEFNKIVAHGTADISADADWTCRFLVKDLKPSREYWYRFIDEHGFASRVVER